MSKVIKSSSGGSIGYGYGYVLGEYMRDNIVGRLLTLIESLGLKDSQEKAVKDIIRKEVNDWFYGGSTIGISSSLYTAIQDIVAKIQKNDAEKYSGSLSVVNTNAHGYEFEIIATEKEK